LANSLAKDEKNSVAVFLMGDAASCGIAGQTTPNGYYNIERMLKALSAKRSRIGICGSCMDARGIRPDLLAEGTHRSSMDELTDGPGKPTKSLCFRHDVNAASLL
jgi:uncharacterized protein involved in oxidation of intracellular sulfur